MAKNKTTKALNPHHNNPALELPFVVPQGLRLHRWAVVPTGVVDKDYHRGKATGRTFLEWARRHYSANPDISGDCLLAMVVDAFEDFGRNEALLWGLFAELMAAAVAAGSNSAGVRGGQY